MKKKKLNVVKLDACSFYSERESITAIYTIVVTDIIYAYVIIVILVATIVIVIISYSYQMQ